MQVKMPQLGETVVEGTIIKWLKQEGEEVAQDEPLFEISTGAAFYTDSTDVRWFYIGCRCVACGLVGCYGDWKTP